MARARQVRLLEGVGYVSAVLVGAACATELEVLRLFHVAGLMFGLIVVVRLLAMNLLLRTAMLGESETPLPEGRPGTETEVKETQG